MPAPITAYDFPRDPYGWVTNNCGHIVLGLGFAVLAQAIGLWWPIPLLIAAVYWVAAEYVLQRSALFLDGLTDTGFVAAGATLPAAMNLGDWWAVGLCAVVGVALGVGAKVRA